MYTCLFLWFFRGWSTRLEHSFHEVESYPGFAFIFADRKIVGHIVVAHIAGQRVSLLVGQPLVLGSICMTCSDVFALQVLQLAVNVVAVAHPEKQKILYKL